MICTGEAIGRRRVAFIDLFRDQDGRRKISLFDFRDLLELSFILFGKGNGCSRSVYVTPW